MKNYKKEKEKFLCDNGYYTENKISVDEAMELQEWEVEEVFAGSYEEFEYKKKVPVDISNDEIALLSAFKQNEKIEQLENDIHTVKTCVVILTICTVVSLFAGIIGALQIYFSI